MGTQGIIQEVDEFDFQAFQLLGGLSAVVDWRQAENGPGQPGGGEIRGCAQKHYAEKRKLVQRPPLSQEQVMSLERIGLDEERADADRLGAGFFLVLVYGRLRFSDAQQVSNLILDMPSPRQGFLEGVADQNDQKSDASSSPSDGSDNESDVDHETEEATMKDVVGKWDPGIVDLGLEDAAVKGLTDKGIKIMALFAFSCNFSPGAQDEKPFTDLIRKLLKRDPGTLELSCMRRLFNESYAKVASDIKARTEATDETPIRRLAPAERASRLKDQQRRLSGISISGQYEPGDTLIDKCISIYDSDRLQYVERSASVSRGHELLTGSKKDASLSFDSSGALKLSKQQKVDPCLTGSEIQVRYFLEKLGVMKYRIALVQKWSDWEKELRSREASLHEDPGVAQVLAGKNLYANGDEASVTHQSAPFSDAPEVGTSLGPSVDSSAFLESTGPILTQSMHEAMFSRNLLSNCNVAGIELPWETEFYRDLFDEDDANKLIPKMPISDICAVDPDAGPQSVAEAVAEVAQYADSSPVHSMFVSCSDDFDFHQKRQQLRDAAIGRLLIVLRHCLLTSVTGRHIISLGSEEQQLSGAHGIADAVVGIRSAATLVKRANSLLSFCVGVPKQGIQWSILLRNSTCGFTSSP
eukprot:s116_g40.t1